MPRVKIDTPGVTIEIDANEMSADDMGKLALQLFRVAGGWPQGDPIRPVGFAATERRWTPDHQHEKYNGDFGQVTA